MQRRRWRLELGVRRSWRKRRRAGACGFGVWRRQKEAGRGSQGFYRGEGGSDGAGEAAMARLAITAWTRVRVGDASRKAGG